VELVRYLLDKGATPNSTANGCHAAYTLIKAADYGFPEIARLLVERGALVNSPNLMGLTPLNFATGTMIPAKSPEQDAGRKAVFEYLRSVGAQFPWELRGEPDPQLIPPTLTTKPKSKKRK